jgi:hypothetical protein
MTRRRAVVFDDRQCAHPGCTTRFTPSGPNGKYCAEHGDERLRKKKDWKALSHRQRVRAFYLERCECCGKPAHGCSYRGVVCCVTCRADAIATEIEMDAERQVAS